MNYMIVEIAQNEFEQAVSVLTDYAWDVELIRIAHLDGALAVDLGGVQAGEAKRVATLLGRKVYVAEKLHSPLRWNVVHHNVPEAD